MTARSHVIVLPGGGYAFRSDYEGEPVAEWLRSLGLEASVFDYPVQTRHPGPINAVRMRVAELRATGVERLGVLGFSAGGHLAGHAAALGLVDAAVLCYPVVSMMTPTHGGSRRELLGRWATRRARAATSVERLVTSSMPPTFVWHTAEDDAVPVEHPYLLGQALARHGVPHALHVYPRGEHGLGLVTGVEGGELAGTAANWTRDCEEWLRELGWID
ncbi:MAG: xylan esterase [Microbacterium sp.]|nr:xylan esterase [Microbacterium sp.]MBA4346495.1 xylan esterase [Microbacterium sp.]